MRKSHLLGALCAFTLALLANTAQATLVTQISSLDIGGTLYDVTFHTGASFNSLWDANNDGVFDGTAPTFWGDQSGAQAAAAAIILALGVSNTTDTAFGGSDSFYVPYGSQYGSLSAGPENILTYADAVTSAGVDSITTAQQFDGNALSGYPYVTFTPSVPVPAAVWLFGSGLLGLIGVARRKAA